MRGSSLVCVCVYVWWFCLSGGSLAASFFPQQSVSLQLVSTLRLIFHSYNPCDERWLEPPGGSVRAKGVQHLGVCWGAHSVFNQLWILQQNHRRWQLFVAADVHKEIENQQRRKTKSTSLCWCTSLWNLASMSCIMSESSTQNWNDRLSDKYGYLLHNYCCFTVNYCCWKLWKCCSVSGAQAEYFTPASSGWNWAVDWH